MALALLLFAFLEAAPRDYRPFSADPQCRCSKPLARLPDLNWTERAEGRTLYQIFLSATTGRELFRQSIGNRFGNEWVKWWNYGITHTADYNADGRPDYAWHGGDDTSGKQCVLLSTDSGYRELDITATLNAAWARLYPGKRRDFGLVLSDYNVLDTVIAAAGPDFTLVFRIEALGYPVPQPRFHILRVPAADFVYGGRPNPHEFRPFAGVAGPIEGSRLVHTADYNADGWPDQAWAGRDGASTFYYLLLSNGAGHRKLDVLATPQAAWDKRYPQDPLDFRRPGPTHELFSIVVAESDGALSLTFRVRNLLHPAEPVRTLRVAPADFVFTAR